jgi:NTE family protein
VPVGVARAMGADIVIAVDLNSTLTSRRKRIQQTSGAKKKSDVQHEPKGELLKKLTDYYASAEVGFKSKINELLKRESATPELMDTVLASIELMQQRITRVNLAVDPPDILIQPRLGELKRMDFDQVEHVIEEGHIGVREKIEDIEALLEKN